MRSAILLLLSFSTVYVNAQDATESPTSTVKGSFQIELASGNESRHAGAVKNNLNTLISNQILYGISDDLELRLGLDFYEEVILINGVRQDGRLSGFSPLLLGLGFDILPEKGILPQITLIGDVFLPFTAGTDFKPMKTGIEFRTVFNHTLGQKASLLYNLGVRFGDDAAPYIYLYTVAYYLNLTDNFGFYTELFGDFHKGGQADHFGVFGLFYQIHRNIQLETIIGTGIENEQDIYLNGRITITFL
jgi:hypothetical protein